MEEWRQAQQPGQDPSESEDPVAHDDADNEALSINAIVSLLMQAIHHEPSTYKEAMSRPDANQWELAMIDELKSHEENGTWILVDRPHGRKIVKSKWVYAIKADGRYKARLVAKGFTQVQGIDYEETFSPVARFEAIRFLLAHAALENWEIEAMDIKTAFLYGELNEEIYMEQPEGFMARSSTSPGNANRTQTGLEKRDASHDQQP